MASVKTAISMDEVLFKEADGLARRLQISRSRLFAQAIAEYIRRHRTEDLIERINAAHQDSPDEEDKAFLKAAARSRARLTEKGEW